jgi:SHS2 domain-containing protein
MAEQLQFEILGHTADFRLRVIGKSLQELFANALKGMSSVIKSEDAFDKQRELTARREIEVGSIDLPALLVDFLNEVLYLTDTTGEVFRDVNFRKFSDIQLEAELFGEKVEEFDKDIKAATHHAIEIKKRPDGYLETTIIFDI